MTQVMRKRPRGPVHPVESGTLVEKLARRAAELTALNADPNFRRTDTLSLAERRHWWAAKRKIDAENRLARLVKGTVKYTSLCRKLYGQDTVPVGPGVSLFEVGTLAFIEGLDPDDRTSFYVLVPCKVLKVTDFEVQIKITSVRGGYRVGAIMNLPHRDVIPRAHVEKPKSRDYVITTGWIWAQG